MRLQLVVVRTSISFNTPARRELELISRELVTPTKYRGQGHGGRTRLIPNARERHGPDGELEPEFPGIPIHGRLRSQLCARVLLQGKWNSSVCSCCHNFRVNGCADAGCCVFVVACASWKYLDIDKGNCWDTRAVRCHLLAQC